MLGTNAALGLIIKKRTSFQFDNVAYNRHLSQMSRSPKPNLPPCVDDALRVLGGHLRTARLRRNMTLQDAAARIGVHRETLAKAESGAPTASLETIAGALWLYGLLGEVENLAAPARDDLGLAFEAARGHKRARASKGSMSNDF
jgi:DNA-binding XRE family transcriptional regulator